MGMVIYGYCLAVLTPLALLWWALLLICDRLREQDEREPRQEVKKIPPVTCGARHEGRTEKAA